MVVKFEPKFHRVKSKNGVQYRLHNCRYVLEELWNNAVVLFL
jgi:hypothetical protein